MKAKKGSFWRTSFVLSCAVVLSAALLNGCSSKNNEGSNTDEGSGAVQTSQQPSASQAGTEKPITITITMMTQYFGSEPPTKDNEAMKLIEEHIGVDLDVNWQPSGGYTDKYTAMMAAGDLPQIVMIDNARNPAMINAVRSGAFWEIGSYLKDYPNLGKLSEIALKNSSIDGKVYGIPRARQMAREGILIRKDWLDNLGLAEPKTFDELMNVVKEFTISDPDKNGQNDTIGIPSAGSAQGLDMFAIYEGAPNQWRVEEDGQFVPSFMTEEYQKVLAQYREMYQNKYINQDFPVAKSTIDPINQGKAGLYLDTMDDLQALFTDLFVRDPKAELIPISRIQGSDGAYHVPLGSGLAGMFMFPKSSVKSEAELITILEHFDKLGDKELQDLRTWGIEGKHYKMVDGVPEHINPKQFADEVYTNFFQLKFDNSELAMAGNQDPGMKAIEQMWVDNIEIGVSNPAEPLISATNTEKGGTLKQIMKDANTKYIMGTIDKAGYDKAIQNWRDSGGDQIIKEYTDEYRKLNP
ncbi:extracellular solute-binding protein [Cohnella cellulosilytica]